ncbi:MAG: FixH family protein [Gammaproteobacteria bacterium]
MFNTNTNFTRWYQEPFAWLVALLPAIAVVGGFYTLRLAIISDDGLVTDDYYKKGLEINQVLKRDDHAAALGIDAEPHIDADAKVITIQMHATDIAKLPNSLRVRLMHATRAGFDRDLTASRTTAGTYLLNVPELAPGHWYIQVETTDWRVLKSLFVPLHAHRHPSSS